MHLIRASNETFYYFFIVAWWYLYVDQLSCFGRGSFSNSKILRCMVLKSDMIMIKLQTWVMLWKTWAFSDVIIQNIISNSKLNCYVLIHANRGSPPLPVSRSICNPCLAILYFFNVLPEQNNFNTSIAFTLRAESWHSILVVIWKIPNFVYFLIWHSRK